MPGKRRAPRHGATGAGPPIVALGGSAGSIEALIELLSRMPADCGLAFLVVLHLAPRHESSLPEIFARRTALRVLHARDDLRIEPGHVYVIPPGRRMELRERRLRLTNLDLHDGARTVVDDLFSSIARDTGARGRTACVVVSGADGDGATGVTRLQACGALTVAQDPAEAAYAVMPRAAIATGCVDVVLRVAEIPEHLLAHFGEPPPLAAPHAPAPAIEPPPLSAAEERIVHGAVACVRASTGQDFSYYRHRAVLRRLLQRMQIARVDSPAQYLDVLRRDRGEAIALQRDLLVSMTTFFRDPDAFAAFARHVPALFAGKASADFVRVWVPGCATGDEVYSVAMLLLEHARTLDRPPGIQVIGSDLNVAAIAHARLGLYPHAIAEHVTDDRLRSFFTREQRGFRVKRALRRVTLFAAHDVVQDAALARMDAVTCRNLLIYLHAEAQQELIEKLRFALKPDGLLFLGTSETVRDASFEIVDAKQRIYRRPADGPRHDLEFVDRHALLRALDTEARLRREQPSRGSSPRATSAVATYDAAAAADYLRFVERLAPASFVVDASAAVVHVSQNMRRLLGLGSGAVSAVADVVPPELRGTIREALLLAAESGTSVEMAPLPVQLGGRRRQTTVRVIPADDLATGFLLVVLDVEPVRRASRAPARPAPAPAPARDAQLVALRRRLRETIDRAAQDRAHLQAVNQELRAANDELRATGEELDVNRQELQSLNEELHAVNHQLSVNLDALDRTNSDLHNLMDATAIPTVFLDSELRIMRFTPTVRTLFRLRPTDVGRPLAHLQHDLGDDRLLDDARAVIATSAPIERAVCDRSGRWFLARILPYRTPDDRIAGAVLTFIEFTDRKRAETALEERGLWLRGQREALETAINDASLQTSLGVLVRTATEALGPGTRAAFYLTADHASLQHVVGMPPDYAEAVRGFAIGPHSLACGLATHTGRPVLTADVRSEPRWAGWQWLAERFDYRGCWSFPVQTSAGRLIGSLAIYSRAARAATARDLELAALLTDTAAIIVVRHHESQVRKQAEDALRASERRLTRELAASRRPRGTRPH